MTVDSVITAFDDKFKARSKMKYQKKIDKMIDQVDIITERKFWKEFIESSVIYGYTDYKGEDSTLIVETITFEDEILVYIMYKIALELSEFTSINLHLKVFKDIEFFRKKQYFDSVITLHAIEEQGGVDNVIKNLDSIIKKINFQGFLMHGSVKKKTAYLLGYEKRNNFYWNTKEDVIEKNIKVLTRNQKKVVTCPVCNESKDIDYNNKRQEFSHKNGKVIFNCNHEKSESISKKKVSISIKKSEIPEGTDPIDFVLFNWKYYAKKWKESNKNETE